ncbi:carbohydrate-binding protein [Actinoplanes sp. NBRC 101535]|uniref:carbohydrate-binding protein n=1 Tax=Actinoplanes sp. NBRC 101535 TaxID=3032196 RepID=UPI0024A4A8C1|nr:carbohydrate-binding protein [Actinoplanes sp. NBRC 101535]GLY05599.1 hypothetical protein Acsp01_59780 [Actinoplanes sp. NBRC 101535]
MDPRTPTVYRTQSWRTRRRALIVLGVAVVLLLGYLIGRWQDSAAEPAAAVLPPAPTASSPAPDPSPTVSPSASPSPVAVEYPLLQAESATELNGVETEDTQDEGGGRNVGWITRNDFMRFDDFAFGEVPATKARIRVASDTGISGRIEIRLDSRDNAPVGEISVSNTGGWQNWRTDTAALTDVTGTHTVFITFTAPDDSEFLNVNWIRFDH